MKAAQINEYGGPEVVIINKDAAKPAAQEGQVLIEVHAASLNPFDTMVREGHLKEMIPLQLPTVLGGDIAGVVAELGTGVDGFGFKVGDKVYGQANVVAGNSGALAGFAATKAGQIANMPAGLSFNDAASLPLVGVSALQALQDHIKLSSGQKILIHGGSGGIGSVAIQIAKHLGAYVATTAPTGALDYVKKLGAEEVIDYTSQKFEDIIRDYDAVFDTVGGEVFEKSFHVVKSGGVIVSMIAKIDETHAVSHGITAISQQTHVTTEALDNLCRLVESGVVTPHVYKVFPLDEIVEAFKTREAGGYIGKIVVSIK